MIEGSLQVKLPTIWTDEKQRWEESEKRREEKRRRKKITKEKVSEERRSRCAKRQESRETLFFQWFVAPEGRKVGSLKRRVRSHVVRWEMKSCTPLWREAHFQVKMCKTHQHRSTFKSCDVEKVHAVVAQSTFRTQNCKKLTGSEYFWKLRCRKSACGCSAPTFRSQKCKKNWQVQSTFGSWDVEKVHAVVARSTFRSQKCKNLKGYTGTFGRSDAVLRGRRWGLCILSKMSQTWGFCSSFKNDGRRGTHAEDLQRCIFRGGHSARDMFIRAVRRSRRWFPERGCILEHKIFRFAEMIVRDRCNTSYDLASIFRARRNTLDRWNGKIAKRIGTRLSALHSTFHFWRQSRRIVSFLMLSTWTTEDVS